LKNSRIVYSTAHGRICRNCGKPFVDCSCKNQSQKVHGDGIVRVRRELKGRRGKTVTVIYGVPMNYDELQTLAGEFKRKLGTGGSVKDGTIIIQGDKSDLIMSLLIDKGFTVKRAGG